MNSREVTRDIRHAIAEALLPEGVAWTGFHDSLINAPIERHVRPLVEEVKNVNAFAQGVVQGCERLQAENARLQEEMRGARHSRDQALAAAEAAQAACDRAKQALRDVQRIASKGDVNIQPLLPAILDAAARGLGE